MAISIKGILLYAKVSPLYNVLQECIVINYIVSKHFDRSLRVEKLEPTCVQISDLYLSRFVRYWILCILRFVVVYT